MEESLINQTLNDHASTADVEIKEIDTLVEDVISELTAEEIIYDITVEPEEDIVIDISESMGWVSGDSRYHDSLLGIDSPNQHPIGAIAGLKEELDKIKALKTVYSDKPNIANYYKWKDASYDECGYFVSLVSDTSTIEICNGDDIFGVSVDAAGFVGRQDSAIPRDDSYGLISTSGLVDVRCELDVKVEDYVVSNAYGYATKSGSHYGYKVLARENKNGVEYAIIMLGVQADVTNALGIELDEISERIGVNEKNIVSAINVANQAYNKANEASKSSNVSEEVVKEALEAILKAEQNIEDFEKVLETTNVTSVQAKAIAENAVTAATSLKNEATTRANDAWAKADEVQKEAYSLCAKIDQYSVGEYSQAHGLTLEQTQNILEVGMIYVPTSHENLEANTKYHEEKYSYVDENENTQTFTRNFIPGYLYQWGKINDDLYGWITIDKHYNSNIEEVYADETNPINTSAMAVYFSCVEIAIGANNNYGYWYTDGDEIIDKDGNVGTYESYTLYKWEADHWLAVATLNGNVNNRAISEVYQTTNQISLTLNNARGGFASIDERLNDTESKVTSTTQWTKGSDASGNVLLYNLATIEQKADDGSSSIVLAVADMDGNKAISGASIVLGQGDGESYFVVDADKIDFTTGTFTIDANHINFEADDFIIKADKIDFTGDTTFVRPGDLGDSGTTVISGNRITTGIIKSKEYDYKSGYYSSQGTAIDLDTGYIRSKTFAIDTSGNAYFNGTLGADAVSAININGSQITAGKIDAERIKVDDLIALGAKIGGWKIDETSLYGENTIDDNSGTERITYKTELHAVTNDNDTVFGVRATIEKLGMGTDWYVSDVFYPFCVKADGSFYATKGKIGGWEVYDDGTFNDLHWIGKVEVTNSLGETSEITLGTGLQPPNSGDWAIAVGFTDHHHWNTAPFKVTHEGAVHASTIICEESINANRGNISITPTIFTIGDRLQFDKYGISFQNLNSTSIRTQALLINNNRIDTMHIGGVVSLSVASNKPLYFDNGHNVLAQFRHRGRNATDTIGLNYFAIETDPGGAGWSHIMLNGPNDDTPNLLLGAWSVEQVVSATSVQSDRNKKNTIQNISDVYDTIFDALTPVTYKYNNGTSNRLHTGFIAQDVESAVLAAGLETKDLAAVCYDINEDGDKVNYTIRYSEFVPLNTWQIQKLKARVAELEEKIALLISKN